MARGGFYSVDSLNGLHVLVVDRDADGREIVAAILRYCGALVTEVASAAEALEVMQVVKANVLVARVRAKGATMKVVRRVRALDAGEALALQDFPGTTRCAGARRGRVIVRRVSGAYGRASSKWTPGVALRTGHRTRRDPRARSATRTNPR